MKDFQFYNPTRIKFGAGVINTLSQEIQALGKRVLFVYGQGSIRRHGIYDAVMAQLKAAGVEVVEHGGVTGNPLLSHAEAGVRLVKENKVDLILAVGGGSVIDESKAIAVGACHDGALWDIYCQKSKPPRQALPIISVLTLCATASEMNGISVLTHDETKDKLALIASPLTNPKVSFLDPAYTVTLSLEQTGYAAADIISHATEGYFVTSAEALLPQDELIEGVVRSVVQAMDILVEDLRNLAARASLMWTATLAWNGLCQVGIPDMGLPCHALEMPMSGVYNIAHGGGLSIVTPAWMRAKADVHGGRLMRFGRRCLGVDGDVEAVARAMEALYRRIGAPLTMSDVGVSAIDVSRLTKLAAEAFRQRGVAGYDDALISSIYSELG